MQRVSVICRLGGGKRIANTAISEYNQDIALGHVTLLNDDNKQETTVGHVTLLNEDDKQKGSSVILNHKEAENNNLQFSLEYLESDFVSSLLESGEHETEYFESTTNRDPATEVGVSTIFRESDLIIQVINQISGEVASDIQSNAVVNQNEIQSNVVVNHSDIHIQALVTQSDVHANFQLVPTNDESINATECEQVQDTTSQIAAKSSKPKRTSACSTGPHNKRGRKLGYRSENSKDDSAQCGVCGDKVSRRRPLFSLTTNVVHLFLLYIK